MGGGLGPGGMVPTPSVDVEGEGEPTTDPPGDLDGLHVRQ